MIELAKCLPKEDNQIHTLGFILKYGDDKSWKVRQAVSRSITDFAHAFGKEITDNNLIQTFTVLLNDNESEVKNAAIESMSQCMNFFSNEKINNLLLPALQNTFQDSNQQFKGSVATAISKLANMVGKDATMLKIIPIVKLLLEDTNAQVREKSIEGLMNINWSILKDILDDSFMKLL